MWNIIYIVLPARAAPSTLKVYVEALAASHFPIDGSAVFDASIRWCIVTEIWRYEYWYSWPCINIVARVQQWTALNLNIRTQFKMFNTNVKSGCRGTLLGCLIQRDVIPETELPTCAIWKYLLSVLLIFVNLANISRKRALSTVDKHAYFLKTPASLQFSDLNFDILLSEKCNSSSVHLWEREREPEKEREMLCMYELPP